MNIVTHPAPTASWPRHWLRSAAPAARIFAVGRTAPGPARAGAEIVHVPCNLSEPGALAHTIAAGALPERVDAIVHIGRLAPAPHLPRDRARPVHRQSRGGRPSARLRPRSRRRPRPVRLDRQRLQRRRRRSLLREDDFRDHLFAASKLFADQLASFYRSAFPVTILRYFAAPCGAEQTDRMIVGLIDRVAQGRAVALPEKGEGMVFAPIYIEDAAAILDAAFKGEWNEAVNAASPDRLQPQSRRRTDRRSARQGAEDRAQPVFAASQSHADLTRLKRRMPAHRFTPFAEGVAKMVAAGAGASSAAAPRRNARPTGRG